MNKIINEKEFYEVVEKVSILDDEQLKRLGNIIYGYRTFKYRVERW